MLNKRLEHSTVVETTRSFDYDRLLLRSFQ